MCAHLTTVHILRCDSIVPLDLVTRALRRIHLTMRYDGVPYNANHQHFLPQIINCGEFENIRRFLEEKYRITEEFTNSQLVYHWPDEFDSKLEFHRDIPPIGKHFTHILGVALTDWTQDNGTVIINENKYTNLAVQLMVGQVFNMKPETLHSPGNNRTGLPRIGLYYRWVHDSL